MQWTGLTVWGIKTDFKARDSGNSARTDKPMENLEFRNSLWIYVYRSRKNHYICL